MMTCLEFEKSFLGSSVGYNITAMGVLVAVVAALAIAFIFVGLFRSIQEEHFSLYLVFCLLSAFTLFLAVVQRLLPPPLPGSPGSAAYSVGLEVFLGCLIAMQWFVQTGAVFFLLVRNPGAGRLRRVFFGALMLAAVLLVPWTVTVVLGKPFVGEIVDESVLVLFFAGSLLLMVKEFRKLLNLQEFTMNPRPMMRVWSGFMLAAHVMFFIMYLVRGLLPGSEVGSCLYIAVDTIYYILYAPLLLFVIRRDSRFWQEHGALMLDMQLVMEAEAGSDVVPARASHERDTLGGVPLIAFGTLQFKRRIGTGGYAEVFLAKWAGAQVAVKVFRVASGQLRAMNELLKEARIMYALSHPNILQLLGISLRGKLVRKDHAPVSQELVGDEEAASLLVNEEEEVAADLTNHDVMLCSVMRFATNGSLFDLIHDGKRDFPLALQLSLLKDICLGMAYLHEQNVIHRDLKSANVLLDSENRGLISDFGLSKANTIGTITMSALGTPHWMAPETLRGDRYSASADVWAFGVIVFEVATRKLPFEGMTGIAIMQRVAHEEMRVRLPSDHIFAPLMDRCLSSDPHARPSFGQAHDMLNKIFP